MGPLIHEDNQHLSGFWLPLNFKKFKNESEKNALFISLIFFIQGDFVNSVYTVIQTVFIQGYRKAESKNKS